MASQTKPKPRFAGKPLNDKQRRFVEEYLVDLNATQAAIRAGYSSKTARVIAAENLAKPAIAAAIAEAQAKRSAKTGITAERVLTELGRIAFVDLSNAFHEGGGLKSLDQMDEDTRRAVAGLEVTSLTEDGEHIGTLKKLKMTDKLGALNTLAKHFGLVQDKLKLGVDPDDPLAALIKAVNGSALKPVKEAA